MQTRFYTNKENLIKFLKWIKENIKDAVIYPEVFGSDHCPVGLEIEI